VVTPAGGTSFHLISPFLPPLQPLSAYEERGKGQGEA